MALKFWLRAGAVTLAAVGAASASGAETIRIKVEKLTYSPREVSAHTGDIIEWVSADFLLHTATAKNGDWEASIPAGKSKSVTLTHEGTIDYYCRFHPNMTGRITVAKD